MRRVSVRDLSGEVIGDIGPGEFLGVTNKGALAGVLVPLSTEILQRLTDFDAEGTAARVHAEEVGLATGQPATDLTDLLDEPPGDRTGPAPFSRVSIRDLRGERLVEAARTGERLVVTRDRVAVALFLPLSDRWVDSLVESSVARFLGAGPAAGTVAPERPVLAPRPVPRGHTGRQFLRQRAIGIRVIGDAPDARKRLVGVVTDMLANIVAGPLELPLDSLDETHVFAQILTLVDSLRSHIGEDEDLSGVGVEIGGHVHQGRVIRSANATWDHFPLAELLAQSLRLPVALENDANSLALYETSFHGIDDDNFAVVLVTHLGLGCGLVLNGQVYRGGRGMAGELGHTSVEFEEADVVRCRCTNPGCLEGVATPRAIELALRERDFDGDFQAALRRGDEELVQQVFARAGAGLGRGIATVLNLLNPTTVVIYAPPELIGRARKFHIDSADFGTGLAARYTGAMVETIRTHAFSDGADECQFWVRTTADEQGARAAAACLIHQVLQQSTADRTGQSARR
ncbi:ROK family protein [Longispora urticae]